CNPQPGVFYLNRESDSGWRGKLEHADIHLSEPFSAVKIETAPPSDSPRHFPIEQVRQHWQNSPLKATAPPPVEPFSGIDKQAFVWDKWPTNPKDFVASRKLVGTNINANPLHLHFREARGVDYTAKRNLLHSLLTARNHMAIITVAEGDSLDLVPYSILPLSLDGPKEDPSLLALDLRQENLKQFRVKNITRVNEVFYSLINIGLLNLLPSGYISDLEVQFQNSQQLQSSPPN
ncbi:MAG: hypothetical protein AAF975_04490, partial [Spirochaetota bacterium]